MLAAPVGAPAQIETAPELPPQALALIKELADQNKQLAANQTAMELKIDEVAEAVRQARLFSARAGRGGK